MIIQLVLFVALGWIWARVPMILGGGPLLPSFDRFANLEFDDELSDSYEPMYSFSVDPQRFHDSQAYIPSGEHRRGLHFCTLRPCNCWIGNCYAYCAWHWCYSRDSIQVQQPKKAKYKYEEKLVEDAGWKNWTMKWGKNGTKSTPPPPPIETKHNKTKKEEEEEEEEEMIQTERFYLECDAKLRPKNCFDFKWPCEAYC